MSGSSRRPSTSMSSSHSRWPIPDPSRIASAAVSCVLTSLLTIWIAWFESVRALSRYKVDPLLRQHEG